MEVFKFLSKSGDDIRYKIVGTEKIGVINETELIRCVNKRECRLISAEISHGHVCEPSDFYREQFKKYNKAVLLGSTISLDGLKGCDKELCVITQVNNHLGCIISNKRVYISAKNLYFDSYACDFGVAGIACDELIADYWNTILNLRMELDVEANKITVNESICNNDVLQKVVDWLVNNSYSEVDVLYQIDYKESWFSEKEYAGLIRSALDENVGFELKYDTLLRILHVYAAALRSLGGNSKVIKQRLTNIIGVYNKRIHLPKYLLTDTDKIKIKHINEIADKFNVGASIKE